MRKLKGEKIYSRIKKLCFEDLPRYHSFSDIPHLVKIKGHYNYYRIRLGDFRKGVKYAGGDKVIVMRVFYRKESYTYLN